MSDKKKIFWSILFPVLAALSVWAVLRSSRDASISMILRSLKDSDPLLTAAAFLCVAFYVLFEGAAIASILKIAGTKSGFGANTLYSAADIYFSAVTPSSSGGQPASAYFMIKNGIPAGVVTAALAINVALYTLATVVLGIIALAINKDLFFNFSTVSKVLIVIGFVIYSAITFFFLLVLKKGKKVFTAIEKLFGKNEQIRQKINKARLDYDDCVEVISRKPSGLIKAFLWNLFQRASQILVPAFLWSALGSPLSSMPQIFASQSLITIGFNCIPIPGAMGVADYITIDGFADLMNYNDAIKLELLSRGISFYLCVIICGLIVVSGYLRLRMQRNKA